MRNFFLKKRFPVICGTALLAGATAFAGGTPLTVTIKDHVFQPSELHFPANQMVEITIKNLDATPEEFESPGLKVEKVVAGGSETIVRIKPVGHGRYTFVGEYHEKTARGQAVVE